MKRSDSDNLSVGPSAADIEFADDAARAELADHLAVLADPAGHVGPSVEQVKANPSRTVYRVELAGRSYYLKQFHSQDLAHRFGAIVRGDDADRELRLSRHLRRAGVAAAEVLAVGRQRGRTWMLSRAVPGESLDVWHDRATDPAAVRRVLHATAGLVGRMHAEGVVHHDLHAGNIMLTGDAGRLTPVVMDLHRAAIRRRLSRRAAAKNLALLAHDRRHATTRTQRLRFLKQYLQAARPSGSLRGWVIMAGHFAECHTRRLLASRDRRIRGSNKYFARLRLGQKWRGHAMLASKRRMDCAPSTGLSFAAADWAAVLARPEVLLDETGATVAKESASSVVLRRSLRVGDHTVDVFVKQSRRTTLIKRLTDLVRPSRSVRAFRLGHALLTRRIATAAPLAAVERRSGPLLQDNILITEAVAPAETLYTLLAEGRCDRAAVRELIGQVARLLRSLAEQGFAHRDLKAQNILVRQGDDGRRQLVLVDLDGVTRHRRVSLKRQCQGLMRLNASLLTCKAVTRTDRLRVLLEYLGGPGAGKIAYKPYWRMLERWTTRKLRRRSRRKR